MDRRNFTKGMLATVSSFALLDALFAYNAFGSNIRPIAEHWAIRLNEYCADLKTATLSASQWQVQIEAL